MKLFSTLSLASRMPWNNSISLTWQIVGYISWGEGIWQKLLSSETWEPETEVFVFLFSTFHHRFPILLEPSRRVSGMMSSCSAKGPRTPQRRINTIHVSFTSAPYHCVHLRMCLMLVSVRHLFLTPQRGRLRFCHSLKQWSHISEQSVHGTLRRHAHRVAGVCSGVFGFFLFYCKIVLLQACQVLIVSCKQCESSPMYFSAVI